MQSMPTGSSEAQTSPASKKRKLKSMSESTQEASSMKKSAEPLKLPEMPPDVLLQISRHLHPYDLLKLCRTTKGLRRTLMSRSPATMSLWQTVSQNVSGLPEPFEGMSIIAWVNLVFYPHCQFCAKVTTVVDWLFRIRACHQCASSRIAKRKAVSKPDLGFPSQVFQNNLIPTRRSKNHRDIEYLHSDYAEVCSQYQALQTDDARLQFIDTRKRIVEDINKHVDLCLEWTKLQATRKEEENNSLKAVRLSAIIDKLRELGYDKEIDIAVETLSRHKSVNKPQILTDRIWANIKAEIIHVMEDIKKSRLAAERQALVRSRMLSATEFLRVYKANHIQERQLMPSPVEFCSLQPVDEIISQKTENELGQSSFETLAPHLPSLLSKWRQKIVKMLCEHLKKPIPLRITFDSDSDDDYSGWSGARNRPPRTKPSPLGRLSMEQISQRLQFATTVLTCNQCYDPFFGKWENGPFAIPGEDDERLLVNSMPLFFPQVLGHECCNSINILQPGNEFMIFRIRELERSGTAFFPSYHDWSPLSLRVDVTSSTIASHLIAMVEGVNPRTTTVEMMDQRNVRYVCLSNSCARKVPSSDEQKTDPSNVSKCPVFDWRSAVKHHRDCHSEIDSEAKLKELYSIIEYDTFSPALRHAEEQHRKTRTAGWSCMHCDPVTPSLESKQLEDVTKHVVQKHSIDKPVEDRDYAQIFAWRDIHPYPLFRVLVRMTNEGPILADLEGPNI